MWEPDLEDLEGIPASKLANSNQIAAGMITIIILVIAVLGFSVAVSTSTNPDKVRLNADETAKRTALLNMKEGDLLFVDENFVGFGRRSPGSRRLNGIQKIFIHEPLTYDSVGFEFQVKAIVERGKSLRVVKMTDPLWDVEVARFVRSHFTPATTPTTTK